MQEENKRFKENLLEKKRKNKPCANLKFFEVSNNKGTIGNKYDIQYY